MYYCNTVDHNFSAFVFSYFHLSDDPWISWNFIWYSNLGFAFISWNKCISFFFFFLFHRRCIDVDEYTSDLRFYCFSECFASDQYESHPWHQESAPCWEIPMNFLCYPRGGVLDDPLMELQYHTVRAQSSWQICRNNTSAILLILSDITLPQQTYTIGIK